MHIRYIPCFANGKLYGSKTVACETATGNFILGVFLQVLIQLLLSTGELCVAVRIDGKHEIDFLWVIVFQGILRHVPDLDRNGFIYIGHQQEVFLLLREEFTFACCLFNRALMAYREFDGKVLSDPGWLVMRVEIHQGIGNLQFAGCKGNVRVGFVHCKGQFTGETVLRSAEERDGQGDA